MNIFFSNTIKLLRNLNGLTLEKLAKQTKIGINSIIDYERDSHFPTLKNLITLSNFFSVSIDFLMMGSATDYPKNLKLFRLARELDRQSQPHERSHIEMTAKSFLDKINQKDFTSKLDLSNLKLSNDIKENIKTVKELKNISSKQIADRLEITLGQVSHYQNRSVPPAEKLPTLSDILCVSIHALVTGEILNFSFKDGHFNEIINLSDRFLSLDHQKFLIELMGNIIQK